MVWSRLIPRLVLRLILRQPFQKLLQVCRYGGGAIGEKKVSRSAVRERTRAGQRDDAMFHLAEQPIEQERFGIDLYAAQFGVTPDKFIQRERLRAPERAVRPREIFDRISEMNHLPVQHGVDTIFFVENIPKAEIAMHDTDSARDWLMLPKPDEGRD